MVLTVELALLLLALLGVGVWGVVTGLRSSRRAAAAGVSAQQLSGLAQPFRAQLGEAVSIQRDVAAQVADAPAPLQNELRDMARRVARLVERAYPRARHGTKLSEYLLGLGEHDPQRPETERALAEVRAELEAFVDTLRLLRGKVYQVLTDATALGADAGLATDLHDALLEVEALEEAFRDVRAA